MTKNNKDQAIAPVGKTDLELNSLCDRLQQQPNQRLRRKLGRLVTWRQSTPPRQLWKKPCINILSRSPSFGGVLMPEFIVRMTLGGQLLSFLI
jgi:hypothetical protein